MINYVTYNKIIYHITNSQFGFLKPHPSSSNCLYFLTRLQMIPIRQMYCSYLYFCKAFDSVYYNELLVKWAFQETCGCGLRLTFSIVSNVSKLTASIQIYCQSYPLFCKVAGILGPLLFLILLMIFQNMFISSTLFSLSR